MAESNHNYADLPRIYKAAQATLEKSSFEAACRPKHTRGLEQFSDEWWAACQKAFVAAMVENPDERPSGRADYNAAGRLA